MTERTLDVLTVGEVLVDFVAPDAPDLAGAETFLRTAGGALGNVAAAVARLGGRAAIAGAVGADPFGTYLRQKLAEQGVILHALRTVPERTTLAFVAQNRGSIPHFVFYRGADATLRPEHVPVDLVASSRFVHLSSMALMSEPARSTTLQTAQAAHEAGTLVSVDPNLRPSSWPSVDAMLASVEPLIGAADILKVNDVEARLLAGADDLDAAMESMGRDDALVVVTRGPEGCLWRWRGAAGQVESPHVEVADTTGAGDAFIGALLAELSRANAGPGFAGLSHDNLVSCLRFACAAAALSCTKHGAMASLPHREEVLPAITDTPNGRLGTAHLPGGGDQG